MDFRHLLIPLVTLLTLSLSNVNADTMPQSTGFNISANGMSRADTHAPIGVMGDHMHHKGGWMLSYRYMRMFMEGSRDGNSGISRNEIVTTVPNPFSGQPMQPPTLRVVPTKMTMNMHMLGLMHAPTNWLTLMLMTTYATKEMDHVTFMGTTGTTILGRFTTYSSGIGDTKFTGMFKVYEGDKHYFHLNTGISFPTGSITEKDDVLAPTGATPTLRLPYPMQIGSGTFDFLPALTYIGKSGRTRWGAQYSGVIRLEDKNHENYSLGNEHRITAWRSHLWRPWVSTSARITGQIVDKIDGQNPDVTTPVQTADPNNQGGERIDLLVGVNFSGQANLEGHRFALEFGAPIYQHLNGPQLETDWIFTTGYQLAF